jgi:DNA-binding PadR family transcriptional regulator
LLVLGVLLEAPAAWRYGYALSQRTGLRSGTLYPLLMRLAERGWLETRWEEPERPGRPPRHVYRLTAEGARAATAQLVDAQAERPNTAFQQRPGIEGAGE